MKRPSSYLVGLMLLVPSVAAADSAVVLRWARVSKAAAYELELASDRELNKIVLRQRVQGNTFRWEAAPDRPHYWRVRSIDEEGRLGPWSDSEQIAAVFVPPVPSRPRTGAKLSADSGRISLEWEASGLHRTYQLELAADAQFRRRLIDKRVDEPRFSFAPREPGAFFWRVRAFDEAGRATEPSATAQFQVELAAPHLLDPDNGARKTAGSSVELRWAPVSLAQTYRVQVARDPAFERSRALSATSTSAWVTVEPGAPLYWRVTAEHHDKRSSPSDTRSVVATEPAKTAMAARPASASAKATTASVPPNAAAPGSRGYVGPMIGFHDNFADVHTVAVDAEAAFRLPFFSGHLLLGLRAGFYTSTAQLATGRVAASNARLWVAPLAPLSAIGELGLGSARLRLGAGPVLHVISAQVEQVAGSASVSSVHGGVFAMLQVGARAGIGEVVVEVRATYTGGQHPLVPVQSGGLTLALGYWFGLF